VIEFLWQLAVGRLQELWEFLRTNYDPIWDTVDIVLVYVGVYWLLLLIKGTRAVQMLIGLVALIAVRLLSGLLQLPTTSWILDWLLAPAVVIIVVLFAADIRRALARVGLGVFPRLAQRQEARVVEEIVRAAQALAQKRVGALIVVEREIGLDDLIEAGTPLDAVVSKDLLVSIFLPYSPLHDGAVVVQNGRMAHAGCILPLTLRSNLPEGVGTRHRAAVGITEETDAVVVVVSEETAAISVVVNAELIRDLDAPRLRGVLRDLLVPGERRRREEPDEAAGATQEAGEAAADARTAG
jgi:uncharacterized protein (TIGR00159 family)